MYLPWNHEDRGRLTSRRRAAGRLLQRLVIAWVLTGAAQMAAAADSSKLRVSGMTFIGSRGDGRDLVLHADRATLTPDTQVAELFSVRAEVSGIEGGQNFSMRCDRAELNLESNDFEAIGDVSGLTAAGERYSAPWVRYVHAEDLLYTDAPVRMVDDTGHFSGNGFRYYVGERRFKLVGDVRVVQGQ